MIPYRTRRFFRRLAVAFLWVLLIGAVAWILWMIWLQRYVVYTRDGAKLDLSRSSVDISGEVAVPPEEDAPIAIYYNEDALAGAAEVELAQILGYYIPTDALLQDLSSLEQQIKSLPEGTAVMLDVKSIYGNFYYSTKIPGAPISDSLDPEAVDSLISLLKKQNLYLIANLPAFRDRSYGQSHIPSGLPVEGGYLWEDEEGCYWLDPADGDNIAYLIQIVNELQTLGFDEVVFREFRFPDSDGEIVYASDRTEDEIITEAARQLVSACATGNFAVSFQAGPAFALPEGRCRLYLENIAAEQAAAVAGGIPVEDPAVRLVFLATSNDTRYNAYSVLRVLSPS